MLDLNEIRKNIDSIDRQLVDLLEERMKLTKEVAEFKIETGKKVLDPDRERAKLEAVKAMISNPDNVHPIQDLFSQIMANSRKNQYMLLEKMGQSAREPYEAVDEINKDGVKVVYQGAPGAYQHVAARKFFGEDVLSYNVPTFRDCMEDVKTGKADYAVLPLENSTAGIVGDVYDLLNEYDNYIVAETYIPIDHMLIGLPGTDLSKVTTVYSHPQGLMQCDLFLDTHKDWQRISKPNTAMAAKTLLDENDTTHVAIASAEAAKIYGLEILKDGISDLKDNTTRFIIVMNRRCFVKNAQKMSVVFEIKNETGSLYNLLSHIIYNGLNMNKIESRPIAVSDGTWNFRFFVDFEGNIDDQRVMNALRGVEEEAQSIKLLGNY